MPAFISLLLGGLIQICGTLAGRVLVALGIGFVTYQGIDFALNKITEIFRASVGASGSVALGVMGVLNFGACFSMICSAVLVKYTLAGLTGGAITRMIGK